MKWWSKLFDRDNSETLGRLDPRVNGKARLNPESVERQAEELQRRVEILLAQTRLFTDGRKDRDENVG